MQQKTSLMILGCGHSESLEHYNNNAVVLADQGNMLIDCGHTIKHALRDQNLGIPDIQAIFVTHVHGDHVFGLERFAYETKYKYNTRIKLIFHESILEELWDQTLKGSLGRNGLGEASLEQYFDVEVLRGDTFTLFSNQYRLVPVEHTPEKPTFGLLINEKVFYSSDTVAIPKTVKNLNFETGFHDVSLSEWNPVHAAIDSMIDLYPEELRKKMYLMSYEDDWREHADKVERYFKGFATQGQSVEL